MKIDGDYTNEKHEEIPNERGRPYSMKTKSPKNKGLGQMKNIFTLVIMFSIVSTLFASDEATILLKNGKVVKGKFLIFTRNSIKFQRPPYTRPIMDEIKLIDIRIILSKDNKILYPVRYITPTDIENMSERDFQMYLLEKQLAENKKLRQELRGVKKATNGMLVTMVGSLLIGVVIILAAGT